MELTVEVRRRQWSPAAVGSGETTPIFAVAKGERVIAAGCRITTPWAGGSTATITLGDGTDPDGLLPTADVTETTAGEYASAAGAYLAGNGKLYSAADTLDVVYTPNTPGATNGVVVFWVMVVEEETWKMVARA